MNDLIYFMWFMKIQKIIYVGKKSVFFNKNLKVNFERKFISLVKLYQIDQFI